MRARLRCSPYLDESDFEHSLLDMITGLEALLMLGKKDEITKTLSDRAAWLAGRDDDERGLVHKIVKKMYNRRSELTHQGILAKKSKVNLQVLAEDLRVLAEISRRAIAACVLLNKDGQGVGYQQFLDVKDSVDAQKKIQNVVRIVCDLTDAPRLSPPNGE